MFVARFSRPLLGYIGGPPPVPQPVASLSSGASSVRHSCTSSLPSPPRCSCEPCHATAGAIPPLPQHATLVHCSQNLTNFDLASQTISLHRRQDHTTAHYSHPNVVARAHHPNYTSKPKALPGALSQCFIKIIRRPDTQCPSNQTTHHCSGSCCPHSAIRNQLQRRAQPQCSTKPNHTIAGVLTLVPTPNQITPQHCTTGPYHSYPTT